MCLLPHRPYFILRYKTQQIHTLSFLSDLPADLPPESPIHDYEYPETPDSCDEATSPKLDFDYDPEDTFADLDEASNCKFLTIKIYITKYIFIQPLWREREHGHNVLFMFFCYCQDTPIVLIITGHLL